MLAGLAAPVPGDRDRGDARVKVNLKMVSA
jgi:hypothetical protein